MIRLYALRGAVCCDNTKESIAKNTCDMCRALFEKNKITEKNIVSMCFSVTSDLDALNPCTALRQGDVGLDTSAIALFCTQEAAIKGMTPRVIRVLVHCYMEENSSVTNVYINGAEVLRPDLAK